MSKSRKSPTQRSLKYLRDLGYTAFVVEHWNHWARIRQDLAGFADIIFWGNGRIGLVQTTTNTNKSARRKKIRTNANAITWVASGGMIYLHAWNGSSLSEEDLTLLVLVHCY